MMEPQEDPEIIRGRSWLSKRVLITPICISPNGFDVQMAPCEKIDHRDSSGGEKVLAELDEPIVAPPLRSNAVRPNAWRVWVKNSSFAAMEKSSLSVSQIMLSWRMTSEL